MLIALCIACLQACKEQTVYIPPQPNLNQLKEGDIILRKGFGLVSETIIMQLHDTIPISHCGILVKENDNWKVIHCLSKAVSEHDGIQISPLHSFINESDERILYIVRYKKDSAGIIASEAKHYLQITIPFDHSFNLTDTSAFFCSELPHHIISKRFNDIILSSNTPPLFNNFLDTNRFTNIYHHFDNALNHHSYYRSR